MIDPFDGELEHRAEAALDRVTLEARSWHRKRPRAFSIRDALIVLQFEASIVFVASASMREGRALSDEDHARLVVACGRINAILDEAVG